MNIEQLIWLGLFLLTFVTLVSFIWVFAPYFPTRKGHLELIKKVADLKPGDVFYELGCGDARVSIAIAKAFPKAQIIGLEMAGPLFFWAWTKAKLSGCKNLKIKWKNIFWQNLNDADAVYVFGMTESLNKKLKEKFIAELKPESRIISYVFTMKDWSGKTETFKGKINQNDQTKISVYTVVNN
ncbi:class I SAM-dependent methyltransferase [bacterium]|nr:class I SAM-dependent methyltransferase [bacterium]NCQ55614.1 class I SAM-dependent methyltransferase [Candidatus Parcubacteria bacterium]NCS67439.1 class I SAM-dependent methyltransferase [Candidatus Peregrinibacteria bacterium]NCS96165.1 class I SAM-dependent methyltransferase [bacterium]